jgi:CHASE3 domain sensor protein
MKNFIKKNAIIVSIILVVVLINLSAAFVIYNRRVMVQNTEMKERTDLTLTKAEAVLNNLQAVDLGLRGYTITKSNVHFGHYQSATKGTQPVFDTLKVLLEAQQYDLTDLNQLNAKMNAYLDFCNEVILAVNKDSVAQYKMMISQDKGFDAWKAYQNFYTKLLSYEKEMNQRAQADYNAAAAGSVWIMVILILISVPTMGFIVFQLKQGEKARQNLFIELEQNNRRYNFDPGTPIDLGNEHQLIDSYIGNSKRAADFVNQVALGQYEADWEGLNEQNATLNQDNLAGALVKMRDQMRKVKLEEARRLWTTEGLSKFSEIIRNHQQDLGALSYQALVFLVKYMKAQQGSLFTLEDEEGTPYLKMAACYAFERRKFMEKRIEIGQGLIGQAYLEAQTILLTDIPNGYTHITSGLGDSTPRCLLIVPMKYNDQVQAIIEIAGFVRYEPYQIEFMEKVGEFVASAVATVQTNEKTKLLLEEFQLQTEQMRAQEEEMRQNMEEMEATQEEMRRKESTIGQVLQQAQEKEQQAQQLALQHQQEKEQLEAQIELLRKK